MKARSFASAAPRRWILHDDRVVLIGAGLLLPAARSWRTTLRSHTRTGSLIGRQTSKLEINFNDDVLLLAIQLCVAQALQSLHRDILDRLVGAPAEYCRSEGQSPKSLEVEFWPNDAKIISLPMNDAMSGS